MKEKRSLCPIQYLLKMHKTVVTYVMLYYCAVQIFYSESWNLISDTDLFQCLFNYTFIHDLWN